MHSVKYNFSFWVVLLLFVCGWTTSSAHRKSLFFIPSAPYVEGEGLFHFTDHTVFSVQNEEQATFASQFAQFLSKGSTISPVVSTVSGGDVILEEDAAIPSEGYELDVTPHRLTVKAKDGHGFFYAFQTLRQLLPTALEYGNGKVAAKLLTVPVLRMKDHPRWHYRGLMIDVSRYFLPKKDLLRVIECASMLKINTLHLHLADDNGWRIEIKKYPRLTSVGASQVDRSQYLFPERHNQRQGEPTVSKGYYTQDDIREIVKYAASRCMEVIPEIEMPAHSNAALAAYPTLACPVVDKFISVIPGMGGNHSDIIYCAGNDSVYKFLQDVIDEIIPLFPSKYIHLGGDEARKHYWKECPLCQKRMRDEHLKDVEELQSYFMRRMAKYVRSKGKQVIGWDELTNSTIPDSAVIMGWQGDGVAALKAARLGHQFIMTPARKLYLIRYQGPQWFEPTTYFGNNTLSDVYHYEPVGKSWTEQEKSLMLGVQASMWTEFCNTPQDLEYLVFPRLAAFAELAWTDPSQKDWQHFLTSLDGFVQRLDAQGVTYAKSMFNIQHKSVAVNGHLEVSLDCERPDVQVRYTTDGKAPTSQSKLYRAPLQVTKSEVITARTFRNGKPMGEVLKLEMHWNKATAKSIKGVNADVTRLVNGINGSVKPSDFEWLTTMDKDGDIVLDLGKPMSISSVSLDALNNYGMAVHLPQSVEVYVYNQPDHIQKVGTFTLSPEQLFDQGTFTKNMTFDFPQTEARYVKIHFVSAGACPSWHVKPGQMSKTCFDELQVR